MTLDDYAKMVSAPWRRLNWKNHHFITHIEGLALDAVKAAVTAEREAMTATEQFLEDTLATLRRGVDKVSHFEESPAGRSWGRKHYWIVQAHKGEMGRDECVGAGGRCAYDAEVGLTEGAHGD